ncbi:MAG: 50S ribosomal protein L6 [Eubacteriales bacterium]|nr:50S ribosomal protein L6 [Eubacteriales bacterium]
MSRIGKLPVTIPAGVTVKVSDDNVVTVKGPKGELTRQVNSIISIKSEDGRLVFTRPNEEKETKALHGLYRTLVNNMVVGVTQGFSKTLEINGTGYRAQKQGNKLVLTLGYSHPVEVTEPAGITIDVPAPNKIVVNGIDKQLVGMVAANIRDYRRPEPYLGKGVKYETEVIRRKVGKTGKK